MFRPDREQVFSAGALTCIAAYFLLLAHASLDAYFSPDDCMNLHEAWVAPLFSVIKANFLFFSSAPIHRALGGLWYRAIYQVAGFDAAPFHAIYLLLLISNILVTYAVARQLTGNRLAGLLTSALAAYQPGFKALYFDTGYVYDVLCYFFYFG